MLVECVNSKDYEGFLNIGWYYDVIEYSECYKIIGIDDMLFLKDRFNKLPFQPEEYLDTQE